MNNKWKILEKDNLPLTPTHNEIMTLWWRNEYLWDKAIIFYFDDPEDTAPTYGLASGEVVTKDWFIDRESAIIPPEPKEE